MQVDITKIEEILRTPGNPPYSVGLANDSGKEVVMAFFLPEHTDKVVEFAKTLEPEVTLNETIRKM